MFNKKYSNILLSSLVFVLSLIIYLLTLSKDVSFTDCGELAAVCNTLGIAHPTGYPLFSILGYLWSQLPLPFTPILSLNIFVAIITALSASFFYNLSLSVLRLLLISSNTKRTKSNIHTKKQKENVKTETTDTNKDNWILSGVSFISALIYAFSLTVWQQAVSLEVYSLQILLINLILFATVKAVTLSEKTKTWFFISAFFLGLGFTNHLTTILLVPAIIFIFFYHPNLTNINKDFKLLLFLIIPFLIGLSVYIYMPLRASTHPEFNWGWVSRNWDKFLYHVQGKQYQIWMFSDSSSISKNLGIFFNILPYQLGWIGIIPLIAGLYYSFKKSWKLSSFLLLLVLACLAYSLNYSIHDIDTYFLTAFIGLLLFTGIGFYYLINLLKNKVSEKILIPCLLIIPIISLALNYNENDLSDDHLVTEYTRIMTENLKPNALVLSAQWDYFCSAFWYKQRVEGYRKDIVLIEKELIRRTWYLDQLTRWYPQTILQSKKEMDEFLIDLERFESGKTYSPLIQSRFINLLNSFIEYNYGKRPIYLTLDVLQQEPDIAKDYLKIPEGFAFRLEKEQRPYPVSVDNIDIKKFAKSLKHSKGHLVEGIRDLVSLEFYLIGQYAMSTNQSETARKSFEKALMVNPNNTQAQNGLNAITR